MTFYDLLALGPTLAIVARRLGVFAVTYWMPLGLVTNFGVACHLVREWVKREGL